MPETSVNISTVRLLTIVTLVLFILGLISAIVPVTIVGASAITWLFAGLVSWTLERLL
jgi:hypothetical protein